MYNANSIPVKKRSFGEDQSVADYARKLELMAEVEHNRWNIEKLMMGYRPTTPEEIEKDSNDKQRFERERFAHTYLKPYHRLCKKAKDYDRLIMKYLWRL